PNSLTKSSPYTTLYLSLIKINQPWSRNLIMKCQQCNVNRATVNMAMQINNERFNIHLCSTCFNEIKNQMGQSGNFSGDLSSHPFFQGQMNGQGENQANQGSYTRTQERDAKKKDNG